MVTEDAKNIFDSRRTAMSIMKALSETGTKEKTHYGWMKRG
jgi:hypothetical protein